MRLLKPEMILSSVERVGLVSFSVFFRDGNALSGFSAKAPCCSFFHTDSAAESTSGFDAKGGAGDAAGAIAKAGAEVPVDTRPCNSWIGITRIGFRRDKDCPGKDTGGFASDGAGMGVEGCEMEEEEEEEENGDVGGDNDNEEEEDRTSPGTTFGAVFGGMTKFDADLGASFETGGGVDMVAGTDAIGGSIMRALAFLFTGRAGSLGRTGVSPRRLGIGDLEVRRDASCFRACMTRSGFVATRLGAPNALTGTSFMEATGVDPNTGVSNCVMRSKWTSSISERSDSWSSSINCSSISVNGQFGCGVMNDVNPVPSC